jgi:SAM-dependent methyltransferase
MAASITTQDPREHWDRQAPIYASDEGHRRFDRFLDLYEAGCWRYIEPVLPDIDAGTILEAGCGTARWMMRLAPMGYRMMLSDLSPEMIRRAREKVQRLGLSDHVAGICPFFNFLPTREHVSILDDARVFETMRDVGVRYAEHPSVVALSGRLLIVAQRQE